jgi:putative transposase
MRQARIKVNSDEGVAVYHCISRTVNGESLFDDEAKEMLKRQLRQIARYCGVEVITYAIMSNHFHILVRVPKSTPLSDRDLLGRFRILYPKPTRYQTAQLEVIESQLDAGGPDAEAWRARQVALMGDVSSFMKLLKQRFSIWFNRNHNRFGTLWAERFKSVLVQPKRGVLQTVAAYIDLNPVRAGLVVDPKDYRFCGYAEALAGNTLAQAGLARLTVSSKWTEVQAAYRLLLFGTAAGPRKGAQVVAVESFNAVVAAKGSLPLATILRHRLRYFSDGAVLGSVAFVRPFLNKRHQSGGSKMEPKEPRPLPAIADWGGLAILHGLRNTGPL